MDLGHSSLHRDGLRIHFKGAGRARGAGGTTRIVLNPVAGKAAEIASRGETRHWNLKVSGNKLMKGLV